MNNIAISPYITLHALQIQNVKRNVVKKVSINELNNETFYPEVPNANIKELASTTNSDLNTGSVPDNANATTEISKLPEPASLDNNNIIGSEIE